MGLLEWAHKLKRSAVLIIVVHDFLVTETFWFWGDYDYGAAAGASSGGMDSSANNGLGFEMECEIDPKDWREEVERVLPSLKVTVRADHKASRRKLF